MIVGKRYQVYRWSRWKGYVRIGSAKTRDTAVARAGTNGCVVDRRQSGSGAGVGHEGAIVFEGKGFARSYAKSNSKGRAASRLEP